MASLTNAAQTILSFPNTIEFNAAICLNIIGKPKVQDLKNHT